MKKSMKRTLSLLLALTMVLSLGLPAYAVGTPADEPESLVERPSVQPKDGVTDGDPTPAEEPEQPDDPIIGTGDDIISLPVFSGMLDELPVEDEIISSDGPIDVTVETDEDLPIEIDPAQDFSFSDESGFVVEVHAPFGALPAGTEMRVIRLSDLSAVQNAVDNAANLNGSVQLAADISFWLEGKEIEPAKGAKLVVKMSAPEIEGMAAPIVVHIPDGENSVPEVIAQLSSDDILMADTVTFEASSFSVYAVVEEEIVVPESRMAINFRRPDGTIITTVYIKNADLYAGTNEKQQGKTYIDDIVFDPGLGENYDLGSNMFRGWTIAKDDANPDDGDETTPNNYGANYDRNTKVYTVDEITAYLAGYLGKIKEGDSLDIYAMIFQTYTISYYGSSTTVSMGQHLAYAPLNENNGAPYTIDMSYTPDDNTHYFEGWKIMSGKENITSAVKPNGETIAKPYVTVSEAEADPELTATVFPNGTKLVVTGNVQFTISAPEGHWLIFKENGKGATFNAPQFVKNGENSFQPENAKEGRMIRNGYSFQGWYEVQTTIDEAGRATPVTDANGNFVFKDDNTAFEFGKPVTVETIIAAKWQPKTNAPYTVIFWGQKLDADDKYDFISSQTINAGTVGTTINVTHTATTVSVTGAQNVTIPTGFEFGSADTGKKVEPEGNTVVNVYLNRKVYTLKFNVSASNYIKYVYNGYTYNDATIGAEVTDADALAILNGEEYASYRKEVGGDVIFTFSNNGTSYYYIKNNGKWYPITAEGYYVYNSTQILRFPSSGGTVKTITAKYGTVISDNFPIIGDDGVAYVHGERWKPGSNNLGWSEVMVIIDTMREDNVTFTLDEQARPLKTMYYYVEALDTDTDTITWNNKKYVLYTDEPIRARYNGVTEEDFVELHGFSKINATDVNFNVLTPHTVSGLNGKYYIASTTQDQSIYFFYSRDKYDILYMDGVYVDGNNNRLDYASQGQWKLVEDVLFESDTTSYNKGGANFYSPQNESKVVPGFVFDGWYVDDACLTPYTFDTMPFGGVQVFAKWRLEQYRVFLRPNVPSTDDSLFWGSDDQSMNFRISRGSYASTPTGTRNGYVFVGWYYDEDFDEVFDAELVPLTDDNVTADYDKTAKENMTDNNAMWTNPKTGKEEHKPINKFGELDANDPGFNADTDRFWITKKLDLYAKWKAILDGAEGISVVYDEVPGEGVGHGKANTAPKDNTLYEDNSKAIAQPASVAADPSEHFLYWVVMKWNGSDWEAVKDDNNESLKVYPGDNFFVLAANAKITPDPDDANKNFYEVQLRAVYGANDGPAPTHITWYSNIYDVAGNVMPDVEHNMAHPAEVEGATVSFDSANGYKIDFEGVKINEKQNIPAFDTYSYEGYVFLGWARIEATDAASQDGAGLETRAAGKTPSELTEDDLFLKWDAENERYLTKNPNARGDTDTWIPALGVAADEFTPYHDLYAVWSGEFYVVHTGQDGAVAKTETYQITRANKEFNLLVKHDTRATEESAIPTNYLYGGYYLEATAPADDKAYDGTNWTFAKPQTKDAAKIAPVGGTTYYVKEVPGNLSNSFNDNYLKPKLAYTYYKDGSGNFQNMGAIYLISMVDGEIAADGTGAYKETGFIIGDKDDIDHRHAASFAPSLKIYALDDDTNYKEYEAKSSGQISYLKVFTRASRWADPDPSSILTDGQKVYQYWVTNDNYLVYGYSARSYMNVSTYGTVINVPSSSVSHDNYSIVNLDA